MSHRIKNSIDESELIFLLHKNNEKALAIIFKNYHIGLIYFATQYLKDSLAAEDVVAESFVKIWQRREDFESLPAIKSFLYITVKNACLNQLRQSSRYAACHEEIKYLAEKAEELFSEQKMIKAELLNKLWQDIEQLPPVRRRIFKMIYVDGLNTFEIASALKISVDTVRVQKARAIHAPPCYQ
ncbi:MAG: sigma-70 family RNA polymerase sigma factor [Bacteroidota bacterium]